MKVYEGWMGVKLQLTWVDHTGKEGPVYEYPLFVKNINEWEYRKYSEIAKEAVKQAFDQKSIKWSTNNGMVKRSY